MANSSPSMLKPTLIGGAVFGVLGGVPFISCACCAWMMGAGFLAAYLYSNLVKAAGAQFRPGNGALIGLVAAMFYSLAASVVGGVFSKIMGPPDVDEIIDQMEQGGAPPEAVDMVANVMEQLSGPMGVVIGFFVTLLIAAAFCTIGGLIGGSVFKVEAQPPAPPQSGGSNLEA